jgi:hypothetical protein
MAKKISNWKDLGDGTYQVFYSDFTAEILSKKDAIAKGIVVLDPKSANIASGTPNSGNKKKETPFVNNWKTDSVTNSSTMSSTNPNLYGGFQGQQGAGAQGTVDPAAVAIFEMDPAQRKELAILLKNAGFKVPTTGKYTDSIVNAYISAQQAAALQSSRLGKDFTVREYLVQEAVPSGGGSTKPSIREDIQIWNPTRTAGVVQDLSVKLLGREATPEEVAYLGNKLTAAQKKAATKTEYVTKGGKVTSTVTGGLDEEQFLIELFQKDKRFAPEIKAIKKKQETKEASDAEITRQDIIGTALNNGITLDPNTVAGFEQRLKSGENIDAVKNSIRSIAALGMPENVKKLVESGVDLATIYSPYRNVLARTLELNPNSITLDDPTLRQAIGPDKEMSIYDFEKTLRQDQRWQYTDQARSEASDIATKVLKDFGFMG